MDEVAAANIGTAPLQGRVFAQWMHHSHPRECPYPHEAGTVAPVPADEGIRGNGQEMSKASREERLRQMESDTCSAERLGMPGTPCGGYGSADLP